jgi:hypothetical protein
MVNQIAVVRAFNRRYTGVLQEAVLDAGYTLTEARLLYTASSRSNIILISFTLPSVRPWTTVSQPNRR